MLVFSHETSQLTFLDKSVKVSIETGFGADTKYMQVNFGAHQCLLDEHRATAFDEFKCTTKKMCSFTAEPPQARRDAAAATTLALK